MRNWKKIFPARAVGCGEARTASIVIITHFHAYERRNIYLEALSFETDMQIEVGE
jgi:hypothetical protein